MGNLIKKLIKKRKEFRFPKYFAVIDWKKSPSKELPLYFEDPFNKVVYIFYTDRYNIIGYQVEDYYYGIEEYLKYNGINAIYDLTKDYKASDILLQRIESKNTTLHPTL